MFWFSTQCWTPPVASCDSSSSIHFSFSWTACILKDYSFTLFLLFFYQGQTVPPEPPSLVMPLLSGRKRRQSPAIARRRSPPHSPGRQRLMPPDSLRAPPKPWTSLLLQALLRPARSPRGNGSSMPKARNREAPLIADLQEHFSAWLSITLCAERALT